MNCAIIFMAVLVSLQAIVALPTRTTLIPRSDQIAGAQDVQLKCFGYNADTYLNGFGYNEGFYIIPFRQDFYQSINAQYGYTACNSYDYYSQVHFGNCGVWEDCSHEYSSYTGLLSGVVNGVGSLLHGVGGLVEGVAGGLLSALSDKELKENTQQV